MKLNNILIISALTIMMPHSSMAMNSDEFLYSLERTIENMKNQRNCSLSESEEQAYYMIQIYKELKKFSKLNNMPFRFKKILSHDLLFSEFFI